MKNQALEELLKNEQFAKEYANCSETMKAVIEDYPHKGYVTKEKSKFFGSIVMLNLQCRHVTYCEGIEYCGPYAIMTVGEKNGKPEIRISFDCLLDDYNVTQEFRDFAKRFLESKDKNTEENYETLLKDKHWRLELDEIEYVIEFED